eukprot:COSAG01_NODE_279_length_19520_cov_41.772154_2_plen_178_part_00
MVYGSDVVYTAQDIRPLVECACTLLQRGPAARLVLAMMRRSEAQRSALRTTLPTMMIDWDCPALCGRSLTVRMMHRRFGQLRHTLVARAAEAGLRLLSSESAVSELARSSSPPSPPQALPGPEPTAGGGSVDEGGVGSLSGTAAMAPQPPPPTIALPSTCGGAQAVVAAWRKPPRAV